LSEETRRDTEQLYTEAVELFQQGDYAGALELFHMVLNEDKNYRDVVYFANLCEKALIQGHKASSEDEIPLPELDLPPDTEDESSNQEAMGEPSIPGFNELDLPEEEDLDSIPPLDQEPPSQHRPEIEEEFDLPEEPPLSSPDPQPVTPTEEQLSEWYGEGLQWLQEGRCQEAFERLEAVHQSNPNFKRVARYLARARDELANAIEETPQPEESLPSPSLDELYMQSMELLDQRHYAEAMEKLGEIRTLDPEYEEIRIEALISEAMQGISETREGQEDQAESTTTMELKTDSSAGMDPTILQRPLPEADRSAPPRASRPPQAPSTRKGSNKALLVLVPVLLLIGTLVFVFMKPKPQSPPDPQPLPGIAGPAKPVSPRPTPTPPAKEEPTAVPTEEIHLREDVVEETLLKARELLSRDNLIEASTALRELLPAERELDEVKDLETDIEKRRQEMETEWAQRTSKDAERQQLLRQARTALNAGNWEDALTLTATILQQDPENTEVQRLQAAAQEGRTKEQREKEYQSSIANVEAALRDGNLDKAQSELERARGIKGDTGDVQTWSAKIEEEKNSQAQLNKEREERDQISAIEKRLVEFHNAGNEAETLTLLGELLELDPSNTVADRIKADIAQRRAAQDERTSLSTPYSRAEAAYKEGKYEESIQILQGARDLLRADERARLLLRNSTFNMGIQRLQADDVETALVKFDEVVALDSNDDKAREMRDTAKSLIGLKSSPVLYQTSLATAKKEAKLRD